MCSTTRKDSFHQISSFYGIEIGSGSSIGSRKSAGSDKEEIQKIFDCSLGNELGEILLDKKEKVEKRDTFSIDDDYFKEQDTS